jgi:hypothetical protein
VVVEISAEPPIRSDGRASEKQTMQYIVFKKPLMDVIYDLL